VRRQYVSETDLPAHTLLGVQALAREEFLIEVDTVAVVESESVSRLPRVPRALSAAAAGTAVILTAAALTRQLRRLLGNRR